MNAKALIAAAAAAALAGCAGNGTAYDATGTFEATEVTLSAQQSGVLVSLTAEEGDALTAGHEVGLIDTTQLWLQVVQADATKAVYESQKPDMQKQLAATRQQLETALREQRRYRGLVADGAAPSKTLDDATAQVEVLRRQLDAQTSALRAQLTTLASQQAAVEVQKELLTDQLHRCHIIAPTDGTVLQKYAERGEYVTPGKPLLKVADTRRMYLRAYVTSARLERVKVGQPVQVFADYGAGHRKEYAGRVAWISSSSEFTPKTILTDDERADLVYAVKIAVEGDGLLKIGMYGQARFN